MPVMGQNAGLQRPGRVLHPSPSSMPHGPLGAVQQGVPGPVTGQNAASHDVRVQPCPVSTPQGPASAVQHGVPPGVGGHSAGLHTPSGKQPAPPTSKPHGPVSLTQHAEKPGSGEVGQKLWTHRCGVLTSSHPAPKSVPHGTGLLAGRQHGSPIGGVGQNVGLQFGSGPEPPAPPVPAIPVPAVPAPAVPAVPVPPAPDDPPLVEPDVDPDTPAAPPNAPLAAEPPAPAFDDSSTLPQASATATTATLMIGHLNTRISAWNTRCAATSAE